MKNILFIFLIALAFTSCSMGDNTLDKKIDASSQELLDRSLISIKKDLSLNNLKDFKDAIKPIIIKAAFLGGFIDNNLIKLKKQFSKHLMEKHLEN